MKMTNSSFFFGNILNLEILFNFSVQILRLTQTNKQTKTVYNTKFTLMEGPKIYVLNFIFREIPPKIEKLLKLQLNWII